MSLMAFSSGLKVTDTFRTPLAEEMGRVLPFCRPAHRLVVGFGNDDDDAGIDAALWFAASVPRVEHGKGGGNAREHNRWTVKISGMGGDSEDWRQGETGSHEDGR